VDPQGRDLCRVPYRSFQGGEKIRGLTSSVSRRFFSAYSRYLWGCFDRRNHPPAPGLFLTGALLAVPASLYLSATLHFELAAYLLPICYLAVQKSISEWRLSSELWLAESPCSYSHRDKMAK